MQVQQDCADYSSKPERRWNPRPPSPQKWIARSNTPPNGWLRANDPEPIRAKSSVRFREIEKAIDGSKSLLALGEDWDEQGAVAIERPTWSTAMACLRRTASAIDRRCGKVLPAPTIGPCADGSIDLYWKTSAFTLLINIQPLNAESDFYGENSIGLKLKGTFKPDAQDLGFLDWLVKG